MRRIRRTVKRKAPTLLTIGNAVGVFATAGLTAYGTYKAVKKVEKLKETVENPTKKEILKEVAPCYISPLVSAILTVMCGVSSNAININRQKALAAALLTSNEAMSAFKKKVEDKIGGEEVKKIVEEQAKEAVIAEEPRKVISNGDYITVYDKFSGYKFRTTFEKLVAAEKEVNKCLNDNQYTGYVNTRLRPGEFEYSEFFRLMDVKPTLFSRAYVWDSSEMWDIWNTGWIDFMHEESTDTDGGRMIILSYTIDPVAKRPAYIN